MNSRTSNIVLLRLVLIVWLGAAACCFGADDEHGAYYNEISWDCVVDGNKLRVSAFVSIIILDESGQKHGVTTLVESDFYKLKKAEARVRDQDGAVIVERKKKEFDKWCGYDDVALYSDHCHYSVKLECAKYPYEVEFEYEYEFDSPRFWPTAVFQRDIPVRKATYSLTCPADFDFRHKAYDMAIEPKVSRPDERTVRYVWQAVDLEPPEEFSYEVPGSNDPGRLVFAAEQFNFEGYRFDGLTWSSIGQWYAYLADDCYSPSSLMGRQQPGDRPAIEALESLYSAVRERVRYVAIEIGIGSWKPYAAEKTFSRAFGDCKDMSTLLVSEARNLGIESYQALVLTRGEGRIDPDFPDFGFNHVIAVALVNSDTIWMDPTCDNCPFGELPSGVQDVEALVVTDEGGELWHIPRAEAADNTTEKTVTVFIDENYHADLRLSVLASGALARYLRSRLPGRSHEEQRQLIGGLFSGTDKSFTIQSVNVGYEGDLSQPVQIDLEARTRKPFRKIGRTVYVDPFLFSELSRAERTDLGDRTSSLNLYYPRLNTDHITVTWDESLRVDSLCLPPEVDISFSQGAFSLTSFAAVDTVRIDFTKTYEAYTIEPGQFEEFEVHRDEVKKALSGRLKLYVR